MLDAFYHGALTPVSPSETAVSHRNRVGREQLADPEEIGGRYTAVVPLLTVTPPPQRTRDQCACQAAPATAAPSVPHRATA